jgi:hypothetical protein
MIYGVLRLLPSTIKLFIVHGRKVTMKNFWLQNCAILLTSLGIVMITKHNVNYRMDSWIQWPRDRRRGFMTLVCVCVLSRRGLCVGLITRPEDSYRVWGVWGRSWSLNYGETLTNYEMLRHGGRNRTEVLKDAVCLYLLYAAIVVNERE